MTEMAARSAALPKPAPAAEPLHRRDFYSWTLEQSSALRSGRFGDIDAANLAEEIEDLGRETFKELESAFRLILDHMLKWDHQPERRSRSWVGSITTQRLNVTYALRDSPGLKSRQDEALDRAYRKARIKADVEMRRSETGSPAECPFSIDDIMNRPFDWSEE